MLEPAYEQGESWSQLADLWERRVEAASGGQARVALLRKLATLQERRLGDGAAAARSLGRAVRESPGDKDLRRSAERMFAAHGGWEDYLQVLTDAAPNASSSGSGWPDSKIHTAARNKVRLAVLITASLGRAKVDTSAGLAAALPPKGRENCRKCTWRTARVQRRYQQRNMIPGESPYFGWSARDLIARPNCDESENMIKK